VLIIGQGTIGLLCLQVAKHQGNKVITMDLADEVLQVSKKLGSDKIIQSGSADAQQELSDFLLENGPLDVVIDAVCNPATANFAIRNVKKGGLLVWVGIPAGPFEFDLITMLCKEIKLHTSYLYSEDDFIRARGLVQSGIIETAAIISKKFPFADTAKAFEYKLTTPSIKVVVEK
jgi:2-desacetyl-2-hydroxyethyl bacteriochlorophyllide A dehydrogenase